MHLISSIHPVPENTIPFLQAIDPNAAVPREIETLGHQFLGSEEPDPPHSIVPGLRYNTEQGEHRTGFVGYRITRI
jgi:hypothetical protein